MNKLDYYRAVLLGFVIGTSFLTVFHLVYFTSDIKNTQPEKPKTNAEVVDTYRGCDIIRWTDHQLAQYKYFMDCSKR
ncbi:hypothetical protein [Synechococcus phage DSL-LC03]|nr:hypothetical protein [Synechococcus phage DSL-LC03]